MPVSGQVAPKLLEQNYNCNPNERTIHFKTVSHPSFINAFFSKDCPTLMHF